jgi:hypothetical protein
MQPFMHDQPQPACSSVEHNSTQRADADYYRPKKKVSRSDLSGLGANICQVHYGAAAAASVWMPGLQ